MSADNGMSNNNNNNPHPNDYDDDSPESRRRASVEAASVLASLGIAPKQGESASATLTHAGGGGSSAAGTSPYDDASYTYTQDFRNELGATNKQRGGEELRRRGQMLPLSSSGSGCGGGGGSGGSSSGLPMPSLHPSMKQKKARPRNDVPMPFPEKLMEVLSNDEISDIICWLPHGKGFAILKKNKFATQILPLYFKQSKYTSFTRKLKRWGFTRVTAGTELGAYYHKFFQRGNHLLCMQMQCQSNGTVTFDKDLHRQHELLQVEEEIEKNRELELLKVEEVMEKKHGIDMSEVAPGAEMGSADPIKPELPKSTAPTPNGYTSSAAMKKFFQTSSENFDGTIDTGDDNIYEDRIMRRQRELDEAVLHRQRELLSQEESFFSNKPSSGFDSVYAKQQRLLRATKQEEEDEVKKHLARQAEIRAMYGWDCNFDNSTKSAPISMEMRRSVIGQSNPSNNMMMQNSMNMNGGNNMMMRPSMMCGNIGMMSGNMMGGNMMSGNMMSGNMGMMNNMNSMMGGPQMFGGGFPNMAGMMGGNGQMNPMAMMQMQQMAAQNAAMSNQMNQMNIPGADLPGRGDGAIPNDLSSNNHQNIMNSALDNLKSNQGNSQGGSSPRSKNFEASASNADNFQGGNMAIPPSKYQAYLAQQGFMAARARSAAGPGFQQDMAGMLQQLEERNKRVDNALKIVGRMNPEAAEQAQQVAKGNSQQPNNNVPPATECKQ